MADTLQPSPSQLDAFFNDLVRSETRLYNAVSDHLQARHGLGVGPWAFLRFIGEHPSCRVADIGVHFAVGIGAVSKAVDRWVAQDWARRDPNPKDRRSSLLSLTDAGRELVADAERTYHAALAELVAPVIDADELASAQAALHRLVGTLEAAGAGTPTG